MRKTLGALAVITIVLMLALYSYYYKDKLNFDGPFKITIRDSDESLSDPNIYKLTRDSINVMLPRKGGKERDSVLYERKLTSEEQKEIIKFLNGLRLKRMEDGYISIDVKSGHKIFDFLV